MSKNNIISITCFLAVLALSFYFWGLYGADIKAATYPYWSIKDDATGGDCYQVGNWDAANKTCSLTTDVYQTIQIDSDNIIFDGDGHIIKGIDSNSAYGIYAYFRKNITIKNLKIENFVTGIVLMYLTDSNIVNNSIHSTNTGIFFSNSINNVLRENIVSANTANGISMRYSNFNVIEDNRISYNYHGIALSWSDNNTINNNINDYNRSSGVYLWNSADNNIFYDNTFSNNFYGSLIYKSSNNKFYNNNFIGNVNQIYIYPEYYIVYGRTFYGWPNRGNVFNLESPIGGNYWNHLQGCTNINNDNFCDSYYWFNGGQDNLPWTKQDGWKIATNQSPAISNLNQYKSDGVTMINEGGIVAEESVVFKAVLNDADNDQAKLQIELKEFNQTFDGQNILESDFVVSGDEAAIRRYSLIDGQYHWRARAIDSQSNTSDWQEFGIPGNVDFEVRVVPLYTQTESDYPSREETRKWFNLEYAKGFSENYGCGSTIAQCGCAITSIVMIAKYHLDQDIAQGKDINPKEINEWLNGELGGYVKGDVNWIAGAKYTGWKIKYAKTDNNTNNYALLDQYINQNNPVIAKANAGRGGINRSHFFVINDKLPSTYAVKDPYWYNTENLIDARIGNYIRNYENGFDGLRIYKKGDGIAQSAITIVLGSPAELLIIDSLGRKLGKDINGIEYSEIPNASYFEDGFDNPASENLSFQERNKLIQILEPADGNYQLQVIGTGEGDYSLDYNFYDIQGSNNHQKFQSETAPGYIAQYNFSFDSENSVNAIVELFDEIPPEAEIFFNQNTQQLEIKGIDNITVNPILSVVENDKKEIYQIQDEAGNMTKLYFEKLKQEGKQIKARLNGIQYNDNPIIEMGADLKYEWSENKEGVVKELNQHILAKDIFDIKAKYNHQKNETELIVKQENQEEIEQTLPEFVIIKLVTKSGVLNFNY